MVDRSYKLVEEFAKRRNLIILTDRGEPPCYKAIDPKQQDLRRWLTDGAWEVCDAYREDPRVLEIVTQIAHEMIGSEESSVEQLIATLTDASSHSDEQPIYVYQSKRGYWYQSTSVTNPGPKFKVQGDRVEAICDRCDSALAVRDVDALAKPTLADSRR